MLLNMTGLDEFCDHNQKPLYYYCLMSLTGLHRCCCLVDGSGKACFSTVNTQWGLDELYCDHCQKHAAIVKHWASIKLMRKFCSCHQNYADATVRFTSSGDCPQHRIHAPNQTNPGWRAPLQARTNISRPLWGSENGCHHIKLSQKKIRWSLTLIPSDRGNPSYC